MNKTNKLTLIITLTEEDSKIMVDCKSSEEGDRYWRYSDVIGALYQISVDLKEEAKKGGYKHESL